MSARPLLVVLLLATGARATGYSVGGSVAGGGLLSNEWSEGSSTHSATFDFESDASYSGTPIRPGLLQLTAGAKYRTFHSLYTQGQATTQAYGFHVNLAGLAETLLPVQLAVSRDWGDFISNLGDRRTGQSTVTSLSASTQLLARGYPSVRLAVLRNIVENRSFGTNPTVAATTALSVGSGYSIGTQTYTASYDTSWNTGTWAENNYQAHAVSLTASAAPTEKTMLRLSERYYLRLPSNGDPRNPRFDDNAFTVGVTRPGEKVNLGLEYDFRDLLVAGGLAPSIAQTGHTVTSLATVHLSADADLSANGTVVTKNERLGETHGWGTSESLGVGLRYRRQFNRTWQANFGGSGSLGLTEPSTGGVLPAFGGGGTAGVSGTWARVRGNANYTIQYQRNLAGVPGWTLSQRGSLNAETVFRGIGAQATLMAFGARRSDALLGTFLNRALTFSLAASWKRFTATATGGISDGLSDALANPVATDGLFLPAPYNTETRFATLTASASFLSGKLNVAVILRTLASTGPLRDLQWEEGAALTASYSLGAFTFSAEERFSTGGMGPNWQRGNLVMFRAMRGFNWNF